MEGFRLWAEKVIHNFFVKHPLPWNAQVRTSKIQNSQNVGIPLFLSQCGNHWRTSFCWILLLRYHLKPNYCIFTWLAHATFFKYVKKYPKKLNSNIPVIYWIAEKLKPWSLKSFLQIPNAFQQCLSHNFMPTLCDILLTFKVCKWSGKLINPTILISDMLQDQPPRVS